MFLATTVLIVLGAALSANVFAERMTHAIPVFGSFAGLVLSHNSGIAFSVPVPSPWKEVLIVVALAAIMYMAWKSRRDTSLSIGFGLIIGGALANLIDRFIDGYVTDYFAVGSFPVFNVADSCITIGAILVLILSLRKKG